MDLLDSPLRVTWDLHGPHGPAVPDEALCVAHALASAGVFFVTLEERPLAHPVVAEILSILAAGGSRVLLICEGTSSELAALHADLPLQALMLDARPYLSGTSLNVAALGQVVEEVRQKGFDPGLLLTPLACNVHLLPDLLAFCRNRAVGRFKLPNVKIDASFPHASAADILRPADLERLRSQLGADPLALHAGLSLEVHDLFLWELLFPGREDGRSEYGGCQAANTLAHVDVVGNLYPCSSWPKRLGSLLHESLEDIWQSAKRFQVRDEISSVPTGCSACRDYSFCLGGCRGLSRVFGPDCAGRDPLCAGPR